MYDTAEVCLAVCGEMRTPVIPCFLPKLLKVALKVPNGELCIVLRAEEYRLPIFLWAYRQRSFRNS
jgi:hypothetical protein